MSNTQNREYGKQKLRMPVLALGGDSFMGTAVLESLQRAASDLYGGVIKQCGHWIADERPEELTRQLFTFFGEERL